MSYEQLLSDFLTVVQQDGRLSDVRPGSVVYSLGRACAAIGTRLESEIESAAEQTDWYKAQGSALYKFAESYGIKYLQAETAKGSMLITSNQALALEAGEIFIHKDTLLRFRTLEAVKLNPYVEVSIRVEAVLPGEEYNLEANEILISDTYSFLYARVGNQRSPSGAALGKIAGGQGRLSETQIKEAIIKTQLNLPKSSVGAIKNYIISSSPVSLNQVILETKETGSLQVWLSSNTTISSDYINFLKEDLQENYVSAGINCTVEILKLRSLSLVITNTKVVEGAIQTITSYVNNLTYRQPFDPSDVFRKTGLLVLEPNNLVKANTGEVFKVGEVRVI